MNIQRALIIDNGSFSIVTGWAVSDSPRAVFPTIIGRPKYKVIMVGMGQKSEYTGDEAVAKRGLLKLSYPIQRGIITNMDDMEKIWHHTFYNELRIDPINDQHPILMTVTPFISKLNKEKITKIMFEIFCINYFYIEYPSKLALYASGRKTGIIIQSGAGITYCIPIYNGKCILNAIQKVNIGGDDITKYLVKIMTERGYSLTTFAEYEIVRDIKEKLCYVAKDYLKELELAKTSSTLEKNYELPDGEIITVGSERFRCTETLFKPYLIMDPDVCKFNSKIDSMNKLICLVNGFLRTFKINSQWFHVDVINILYKYVTPNGLNDGIHQLVYRSIMKCDVNIRKDLFSNIILCGGNTMFDGLDLRLKIELERLILGTDLTVNVVAPPGRKYSVWIGGSVFIQNKKNNIGWITKAEYDQYGPTIVHEKCFLD